jgi:uncharacterized protein (DUF1810 family)
MADDPFNLQRFVDAQQSDYSRALMEIRAGRKRSHWMWYIFPQIKGLGFSPTSIHFAISGADEARAYLSHPLLGTRLIECATALLQIHGKTVGEIFGSPDDLKLRSSVTLFAQISPSGSVFHQVLDRYFEGKPDLKTIELLSVS